MDTGYVVCWYTTRGSDTGTLHTLTHPHGTPLAYPTLDEARAAREAASLVNTRKSIHYMICGWDTQMQERTNTIYA